MNGQVLNSAEFAEKWYLLDARGRRSVGIYISPLRVCLLIAVQLQKFEPELFNLLHAKARLNLLYHISGALIILSCQPGQGTQSPTRVDEGRREAKSSLVLRHQNRPLASFSNLFIDLICAKKQEDSQMQRPLPSSNLLPRTTG